MNVLAPVRRPSVAARRVGYVIAAMLTVGLWYIVNVEPGWRELSFLTDDTARVLALFNLSLAISVMVNVLYLAYDSPWVRALGDMATTGVGLAVLVRVWQVFPFAFTGSFDWPLLVRVVLIVAIGGSIIGIVVSTVTLLRWMAGPGQPGTAGRYAP
jgi:hypothetical protein